MRFFKAAILFGLMSLPCHAESDWLLDLDLDSPIQSKDYVSEQPADLNPHALRELVFVYPRPKQGKDPKKSSLLPGFEYELRQKVEQLLLRPERKPAVKRPVPPRIRVKRNERLL